MTGSLDPRLLETFRVVAQAGSVSAAARRLHLSQPAVTGRVRALEEACGRPLFLRTPQGVRTTGPGRALLEHAVRLEALLQDATHAVRSEAPEGELAIAASTTIAGSVLPRLLARFQRRVARVRVRVEVGNTRQVLARVKEGAVPLGLVEGHPRAAGLTLTRFLEDALVPVVAGDAPARLLRLRRPADLADVPILWREAGSGTRAVVERALRAALKGRRETALDWELGSTEAIKAAAAESLGVAFLSRWSLRLELETGRLRVLDLGLSIPRRFSWVLSSREPQGIAGRFHRFAMDEAPALTPR